MTGLLSAPRARTQRSVASGLVLVTGLCWAYLVFLATEIARPTGYRSVEADGAQRAAAAIAELL